ncbi:MAG: hypothetical protein ACOYIK_06205 [Coriobacteriales bacterium]|jgi:hypothetical protein
MSKEQRVKPNALLMTINIIDLIIALCAIGAYSWYLVQFGPFAKVFLAVWGIICGVIYLFISISGFRGRFTSGKVLNWIIIVYDIVMFFVLLATGTFANSVVYWLIDLALPILWLVGASKSENRIITW